MRPLSDRDWKVAWAAIDIVEKVAKVLFLGPLVDELQALRARLIDMKNADAFEKRRRPFS